VVKLFSDTFDNFIYLNLERQDNQDLFKEMTPIHQIIQMIQLKENIKVVPGKTLLFVDEIQQSAIAMNQLRYFYEEVPDLHVIAAGSLLEVKMKKEGFSFPVGRVEYCYMHPVTFDEYLLANGDTASTLFIESISLDQTIPEQTHHILMKKFYDYLLIGGMPEAVSTYVETKNLLDLNSIYESITTGFKDDVFKYSTEAKAKYLQFIIENAPKHVGQTIKYERFSGSGYRSREISEAFDVLEKAMIVSRVYASSSKSLPLINNMRKSPKLLYLDVGLINYKLNLRAELIKVDDINTIFQGQISEQIVGQTLLSLLYFQSTPLSYWYREQQGATSEVDFLMSRNNKVIPIEVKSGKSGTLKSLHSFIEESKLSFAIRIYSGAFQVDRLETPSGKAYTLLSLPYYLLYRINNFIDFLA
ncbi:MAG: ATP-binding protein, partial [Candidatus Margulisiibacteriota bacterium]